MYTFLNSPVRFGIFLAFSGFIVLIIISVAFSDSTGILTLLSVSPFLILIISLFFIRGEIGHYGFLGASVGAIAAVIGPTGYVLYSSDVYGKHTDSNIMLVLLLMPVLSVIASISGWLFGRSKAINTRIN